MRAWRDRAVDSCQLLARLVAIRPQLCKLSAQRLQLGLAPVRLLGELVKLPLERLVGALELFVLFRGHRDLECLRDLPRLPSERRIRLAQPLHLIDQGHVSLDVTRFLGAELLVLTDELEGLATRARGSISSACLLASSDATCGATSASSARSCSHLGLQHFHRTGCVCEVILRRVDACVGLAHLRLEQTRYGLFIGHRSPVIVQIFAEDTGLEGVGDAV